MRLHSNNQDHDSELRGQEEAGCMQQMSELFIYSTAVKFANAINKPIT